MYQDEYKGDIIDKDKFKVLAEPLLKSGYGKNLLGILNKED